VTTKKFAIEGTPEPMTLVLKLVFNLHGFKVPPWGILLVCTESYYCQYKKPSERKLIINKMKVNLMLTIQNIRKVWEPLMQI